MYAHTYVYITCISGYVSKYVYLTYSDNECKKNIPLVPNPMIVNDGEKPANLQNDTSDQASITEGPYMISDNTGGGKVSNSNSQPLHPPDTYDQLQPLRPPDTSQSLKQPDVYDKLPPKKVRYVCPYMHHVHMYIVM